MKFTHEETTVRDFIKRCEDIDIYDDVCEELGIAFCGPMGLTEEGEREFAEILDLKVDIYEHPDGYKNAVLRIDDESEKVWKCRLRLAKEFFEGMAGYCSEENYETCFINRALYYTRKTVLQMVYKIIGITPLHGTKSRANSGRKSSRN